MMLVMVVETSPYTLQRCPYSSWNDWAVSTQAREEIYVNIVLELTKGRLTQLDQVLKMRIL